MKYWLFVFIFILLTLNASATPPSAPPCTLVDNPQFYQDLALSSRIYSDLQAFELKNISVGCSTYGTVPVTLNLESSQISAIGLTYHFKLIFSYRDGKLYQGNEVGLVQISRGYTGFIQAFENNQAIKFFITTTGLKDVHYSNQFDSEGHFTLGGYEGSSLSYSFVKNSIDQFVFVHPLLIINVDKFIPSVSNIPKVNEYRLNIPIKRVELTPSALTSSQLSLFGNKECPTCDSFLVYDLQNNMPRSYLLPHTLTWKAFPEIATAHKIMRESLLNKDTRSCVIGQDLPFAYTRLDSQESPSGPYYLHVSLLCSDMSRTASVQLNVDNTYQNLRIEEDVVYPKSSQFSVGYYLLFGTLGIIFLIFIIWIIKKRRQPPLPIQPSR